jgi:hypothetical protein
LRLYPRHPPGEAFPDPSIGTPFFRILSSLRACVVTAIGCVVSTELVDVRKCNTIWADSYDQDFTDIFAIQSEVAQTIVRKLTATLSLEEKRIIEAKPTDDLDAYDLFLRAKPLILSVRLSSGIGTSQSPDIAIGSWKKLSDSTPSSPNDDGIEHAR